MNLHDLKSVRFETWLPISAILRKLQDDRYGAGEGGDIKRLQDKIGLAEFVMIRHELKEHINTLESILDICEAVAKGRYLQDQQRCHWGDQQRCDHACTSQEDAQCEMFDARDPWDAILGWLEDLRPLSELTREWARAQLPLQQKLRQGFRGFLGNLGNVVMYETVVIDGEEVLKPMAPDAQARHEAVSDALEDAVAGELVARVEDYAGVLEAIRTLCQRKGDVAEVARMITGGGARRPREGEYEPW